MIGIIDYGMGNLKSVQKAFEYLGYKAVITSDKARLRQATHLVLPGVGAFKDAIATLHKQQLVAFIKERVDEGIPFLGICLGMQLLFEVSHEHGRHEGLGLLEGEVVRFKTQEKIPHMGWNTLDIKASNKLFDKTEEALYMYFVHSYYVKTQERYISAYTTYDQTIAVAVEKDKLFGVQFHPEKSHDKGLEVLRRFAQIK